MLIRRDAAAAVAWYIAALLALVTSRYLIQLSSDLQVLVALGAGAIAYLAVGPTDLPIIATAKGEPRRITAARAVVSATVVIGALMIRSLLEPWWPLVAIGLLLPISLGALTALLRRSQASALVQAARSSSGPTTD